MQMEGDFMSKYMDMHMHSIYSDGTNTVEELLEKMKSQEIGTFAITDHDNVGWISDLKKISTDLEWYSGVEVSTIYHGYKIHLLGYGFDENNPKLQELLFWIRNQRKLRFYDMLENARKEFQVEVADDFFQDLETKGVILGKPHLMQYLLERGCGKTALEIFDHIDKTCTSQIQYRADLKWAIDCLKDARAILSLAHPGEIEREHQIQIESIIENLLDLGIDGIEVYHSSHSDQDIKRFHALTNQYQVLESGGSDYHGPYRKERELGFVSKSRNKVKRLTLVEELRKRK